MEDEKGRPMTYWGGKPESKSPSVDCVVHTPGPWEIQCFSDGTIDIDGPTDDLICQIPVLGVSAKNFIENANLIAAAPDLLAALREIRGELCRRHSPFVVETDYAYINDAINKATGKVV